VTEARAAWVQRAAAIVAAALVAVIAYIVLFGGDDHGSNANQGRLASKRVLPADASKVRQLATQQGHPVYWAGPAGAETFEWTDTSDGRIYIRYLTGGAKVGDPSPDFLTVGTYPVAVGDAATAVRRAAKNPGARTLKVGGDGTALVNENNPSSVYLAYPGSKYQVEVYDPGPARALKLVTSGKIQAIP
jgi:hypothetical protein